jgi:AraC-like DNA-binding protein
VVTATGGFASTAVLALVIDVLGRIDPALLLDDARAPDYLADAAVSAQHKSAVLQHAMAVGGAGPLLSVGGDCARLATLPIFESLLRASTTGALMEKWLRLESYFHHAHRTRIGAVKNNAWACERYTDTGVPPIPENLLICGFMLGLLSLYGVKLQRCAIGTVKLPIKNGSLDTAALLARKRKLVVVDSSRWHIRWQVVAQLGPRPPLSTSNAVTDQLSALLACDVGAQWRLEDVATQLGQSRRSLQRLIAGEGHTFSSIVRKVRIQSACALLSDTNAPIADIGFCCGFADQAHFQRNFKRATNMTPARYRQL